MVVELRGVWALAMVARVTYYFREHRRRTFFRCQPQIQIAIAEAVLAPLCGSTRRGG